VVTLDQAGWNSGMLVLLTPPPVLSNVVEFFWIDRRPRQSPRAHEWRVVADDAANVIYARVVDDHGREQHRLHVVGARSRYADVDCSRRVLTVGARLRPGALPALFRVDAVTLTDRSVPMEALVRPAARHVLARLELDPCADAAGRLASVITELTARGRPLDDRTSILHTITSGGTPTVRDLAGAFGVGDRALRSWCAVHLGLGLTRFVRVRRLHAALERRLRNPFVTWSTIAAATGFADQPHLVRDFRALLGESPGAFLARAS
jgi:AraC-like DNA-binding protein